MDELEAAAAVTAMSVDFENEEDMEAKALQHGPACHAAVACLSECFQAEKENLSGGAATHQNEDVIPKVCISLTMLHRLPCMQHPH